MQARAHSPLEWRNGGSLMEICNYLADVGDSEADNSKGSNDSSASAVLMRLPRLKGLTGDAQMEADSLAARLLNRVGSAVDSETALTGLWPARVEQLMQTSTAEVGIPLSGKAGESTPVATTKRPQLEFAPESTASPPTFGRSSKTIPSITLVDGQLQQQVMVVEKASMLGQLYESVQPAVLRV